MGFIFSIAQTHRKGGIWFLSATVVLGTEGGHDGLMVAVRKPRQGMTAGCRSAAAPGARW